METLGQQLSGTHSGSPQAQTRDVCPRGRGFAQTTFSAKESFHVLWTADFLASTVWGKQEPGTSGDGD